MRGYRSRTFGSGRVILHAVEDVQNLYVPGGCVLDSSVTWYQGGYIALAGTPIYAHTTGLYRPFKGGVADGAGTDATALILEDDGSIDQYGVGDAIYVGAARTVTAINYETRTITLSAASTWTDGMAIGPSNGYRAATNVAGIVSDEFGVDLRPDGVTAENRTARVLQRGRIKADMVLAGNGLFASIAAGEQPYMNDFQFWRGDQRVA